MSDYKKNKGKGLPKVRLKTTRKFELFRRVLCVKPASLVVPSFRSSRDVGGRFRVPSLARFWPHCLGYLVLVKVDHGLV